MDRLLGKQFGEYTVIRRLADGGTASVFECLRRSDRARFAIKVLAAELRDREGPLARLLQEGRAIQSLRHEHIVRVFDLAQTSDGLGYIVMELIDGQAIDEILDAEGVFEPSRAIFIARQLCDALSAAHARGIYHRDIKPANVMVMEGARHSDFVKILDFGVARLALDDPNRLAQTAQGMTLGTPQYMSPEQAQALKVDARSDVYQLGLLLYEMLVGAPPFDGNNPVKVMRRHLQERPEPLCPRRPEISEALEAVVLRCLEKAPTDRYASAQALAKALDGLVRHTTGLNKVITLIPGSDTTVGNLALPTLGNPADLDRYADNLAEVLMDLWPDGAPTQLVTLYNELDQLAERVSVTRVELASQRAEADRVATELEERLRPLERAIESLAFERAALENDLRTAQASQDEQTAIAHDLDAAYAVIYGQIERHQAQLYGAAAQDSGVDFRALFREDIEARLSQLNGIYRQRIDADARLSKSHETMAQLLPRIRDLKLQLSGLERSRLGVEAQRVSDLGALEFQVRRLEDRTHALERAREHRALALGLAFRQAVNVLIDTRKAPALHG
jgi:serine/threonine protein kinase/ribosome-associated translation inhibitor RaiA